MNGTRSCSIVDCERPHYSQGLCNTHYARVRRGKPVGTAELQKVHDRGCLIDGCDDPHNSMGYCGKHAKRLRTHGDTETVKPSTSAGARHANWVGNAATYITLHQRIRATRGLASSHQCVDCGGTAAHWSYNHSDPGEVPASDRYPEYSLDVHRYEPRCLSCHRRFDINHHSQEQRTEE